MPARNALILLLLLAGLCLSVPPVAAQREGLLPVGDPVVAFLERQQAASRLPGGSPLDVQPLAAAEAQRLLDSLARHAERLSPTDRALLARFRGEAPYPGAARLQRLSSLLYADGRAFFRAEGDGYSLEVEPLLYLAAGPARALAPDSGLAPAWQNTRGVRFGGRIGRHLFFETRLTENQRRAAEHAYAADRFTAPRLGDVKEVDGRVYDYWLATGSVGYRDRFVEIRAGREINRWGAGANSLFLSDYAAPYDQLQARFRFWRLDYTSLHARFIVPERRRGWDSPFYPAHYGAFHTLSVALPGRVDLQLFESVVYAPDSLDGQRRGFEFGYLNPFQLFRPVEVDLGSPDNMLLGAGLAWRPVPGVRTYGQLLVDEVRFRELFRSWYGNKYAWLLGAHLVDAGVPDLDVRAEYARLRPYMYSHRSEHTAYVHFNDTFGHSAGPNAQDVSVFVRYRPAPTVEAGLNAAWTMRGRNTDAVNFGSDARRSYLDRPGDYGVVFFQGVRQTEWLGEARLGVEVLPALVLEGALVGRLRRDAEQGRSGSLAALAGMRWGLPFRSERW
ncbi:MAG: hypothetical protein ACK41D_04675 [Rubricoccaceae bacterium]